MVPGKYETEFVILFKLFALALITVTLERYSGINMIFWCLALGLIASHFGLFRGKILARANSLGIAMAALLFYAFTMMNYPAGFAAGIGNGRGDPVSCSVRFASGRLVRWKTGQMAERVEYGRWNRNYVRVSR
jgi:hypothetical protein